MQRLFTAVAIPEKIARQLVALQPGESENVRPVRQQQLHLTLHFIGQADTEKVIDVLKQVRGSPFLLQVEGLGKFMQKDGASVLWAGVRKSNELLQLHQSVRNVLAPSGFVKETNNYVPHITLARCNKNTPPTVGDLFLSRELSSPEPFTVNEFGLYSSSLYEGKPVYRVEQVYSLAFY